MVSAQSDPSPTQLKILIAGGFGAGKTTFVGSVSEIRPLVTEETLTIKSIGADDLIGIENKTTTTVAMDFGRITFRENDLVLYLFGTPGQDRFWFMWEELCQGTLGAVVLADTRRLADCFAVIEFFERRGIRFVVAINEFPDSHRYPDEDLRAALRIQRHVPLVTCDARVTRLACNVLGELVEHIIDASSLESTTPPPDSHTEIEWS